MVEGSGFDPCAANPRVKMYVRELARPPLPALALPTVRRFPRGDLDRFEIRETEVLLGGWTEVDVSGRAPEVRLVIAGAMSGPAPDEREPGSLRRWNFTFRLSETSPDDVMRVEASTGDGYSNILAMGTLRPYLPKGLSGRE